MKTSEEIERWKEKELLRDGIWRPEARELILYALDAPDASYAGYTEIVTIGCVCVEATADVQFALELHRKTRRALEDSMHLVPRLGLHDRDIDNLGLLVRCCQRVRLAILRLVKAKEGETIIAALARVVGTGDALHSGADLYRELSSGLQLDAEISRLSTELGA